MPRQKNKPLVIRYCMCIRRLHDRKLRPHFPVLLLLPLLFLPFAAPAINLQSQTLTSISELDSFVAASYTGLLNEACIYPPGPFRFAISCGTLSFADGSDLASLTNVFSPGLTFGVQTYQIAVVETQDTSRVWFYQGTNGIAFRTNAVPAGFDPDAWVRSAYRHDPPEYLNGDNLTTWYAERDRSRLYLTMTLVNSNALDVLLAAEQAAATNTPSSGGPPPVPPADSNSLAFAGILTSHTNTMGIWLYSPSNRPVAMLTRPTLTMTKSAWSVLGTLIATPPFEYLETPMFTDSAFYLAGFSDQDTDGDGIPDAIETYVSGTNPDSADSDGDGINDYNEIYVFGTDPWNPDTSPPLVCIVAPAANEWKAVVP